MSLIKYTMAWVTTNKLMSLDKNCCVHCTVVLFQMMGRAIHIVCSYRLSLLCHVCFFRWKQVGYLVKVKDKIWNYVSMVFQSSLVLVHKNVKQVAISSNCFGSGYCRQDWSRGRCRGLCHPPHVDCCPLKQNEFGDRRWAIL